MTGELKAGGNKRDTSCEETHLESSEWMIRIRTGPVSLELGDANKHPERLAGGRR